MLLSTFRLPSSRLLPFCSARSDLSYILLHDAMLLLLQLASPALHKPSARAPAGTQPLLDCMHAQRQLAAPLVQKLLQVRHSKWLHTSRGKAQRSHS